MFSFHKPKIYRSNLGCCICKAKSSSSRFTDSKKYETEFEHCFRIEEKRSGEICNACVLLVKRWKKLSPENRSIKHWHHVVDARAGPGTKLTGGRRMNGSLSNRAPEAQSSAPQQARKSASSSRCDLLPLSSSQANNQLTGDRYSAASTPSTSQASSTKRFSTNKARAIDTNVSTFTFGEPIRRSYMTSEAFTCVSSGGSGSQSLHKAYSSVNSSTFESVIKRFRQRQHQEQVEAERRQQNRRRRQQQQTTATTTATGASQLTAEKTPADVKSADEDSPKESQVLGSQKVAQGQQGRRVKRSSESIGALAIDGVRVSSLLDGSLWRKEKLCCGIIFRGLFNEVAISPKLLKPCLYRQDKLKPSEKPQQSNEEEEEEEEEVKSDSGSFQDSSLPCPRATKSGSISSCDSNTSGTGSMEQPLDESLIGVGGKRVEIRKKRQLVAKGVTQAVGRSLRHSKQNATSVESSSSSTIYLNNSKQALHSPSSSSGASSLRLNNTGDEEDELELEEELEEEDEEEEDEVLLGAEEEISSSSVDSLAGVEGKSSSVGAIG